MSQRSTADQGAAPDTGRDLGGSKPERLPAAPAAETMIVPIDAWNKMINQLGNLHEAGRELAEARERAAKAETEARFLRERLVELRQRPSAAPAGESTEAAVAELAEAAPTLPRWRLLSRRLWKGRG